MLHRIVPTGFQNVVKADDIGFDIDVRMVDRVSYACLGSKVDDDIKAVFGKKPIDETLVCNRAFDEHMPDRAAYRCLCL